MRYFLGGLKTIAQAIGDIPNLKKLNHFLKRAELIDALGKKGPFTVFAPSDAAFTEKDVDSIRKILRNDRLRNDKANLKKLLLRHVVQGKKITHEQFPEKKKELDTMNGVDKVMIWKVGEKEMVGFKDLKASGENDYEDIEVANGVIHIISDVLMLDGEFKAPQNATTGEYISFKIMIRLLHQYKRIYLKRSQNNCISIHLMFFIFQGHQKTNTRGNKENNIRGK